MRKNERLFNTTILALILLSIFLLIGIFKPSNSAIEFKDPQLELAVRNAIGKEEGPIERRDVEVLQTLNATGYGIEDLEGIEELGELRELILENNRVKSVTPLTQLTKLTTLNLRNNEITSLEAINFEDIIYLPIVDLSLRHNVKRDEEGYDTRLSDITLVGKILGLEHLDLRDNDINDLTPLSHLRDLQELDIRENKFDTIQALETLTQLEELNIRDNTIESLEPLRYLSRLTKLNIHSVKGFESLEPISGLVNLETLIMRNVEMLDNGRFLRKMTNLQRLNAIDTNVDSIDPEIIEYLLARGALQGEVRPERLRHTIGAPELSKESGFYSESFELTIDNVAEDSEVYYTLDGSVPTRQSTLYTEPLIIEEVDEQSFTIVRAKVYSENNTESEISTKSYFVHDKATERFSIPVVSLVTDPSHLFDEETGIYTDENALKRGSEWERPVHIEYFEAGGHLGIAQNGGLRIHGGTSRSAEQKSLRLYASSEYDEHETFDYPFFEELTMKNADEPVNEFKRLLLRNSGNDRKLTMFNDGLTQEIIREVGTIDTQAYQPAVLFINGKYYGIQNIRERLDEYYVASHYDVNIEDIAILENNSVLYRGGNSDVYHYRNMLKYIEENGLEDQEHFEYIKTLMDTDNFIDYFASEIFFANADWPGNNIQYWRKTIEEYEPEAPYGHDGRWRWMILDMDFGFYRSDEEWGDQNQPLNHNHNTIQWVMSEYDGNTGSQTWPNFLFRSLMSNDQFQMDFLNRINDLMNSYYSEQVTSSKLNSTVNNLKPEIPIHIEQMKAIQSLEVWEINVDRKHIFTQERPPILRDYIMEEFNIEQTINVNVTNETEEGFIRLNTLAINSELPGNDNHSIWTGTYFTGVPIKVEAIAKDGYQFSHWENMDEQGEQIEIMPSEDIRIHAVFTKQD